VWRLFLKHTQGIEIMAKIVVNGASGHIGQLIVAELAQRTAMSDLTLVSRTPERLSDWAEKGARVCQGDYRDATSLDAAYAGSDILLMISGLDIRHRIEQHRTAIAAAKRADIKHIVYTAGSGVHPLNRTPSARDHIVTEHDLRGCGLDYTIIRNQAYADFMTGMAEMALRTGTWFHVGERGLFSPVARSDIARSAAAILLEPTKHRNFTYEITGPELISFQELARRFADLYNRPIEYVPLTAEQMYEKFDAWGAPRIGDPAANDPPSCYGSEELVENYVAWDELYHAVLSHHVELITGKPPISLAAMMEAAKPDMERHLALPA
jgi:NAD(P)H dehydrogenase (quinone)